MASTAKPLNIIKLRGRRKRKFANTLLKWHSTDAEKSKSSSPRSPIRVVCISDTHNTRPSLPDGDILIHAGDLTENGSFDEMQAELNWLSSQPHRYKILIAGNHDVLLDEEFLDRYPERRYGQIKSKKDLNWGSVLYLQDTCVTVDFPKSESYILQTPRKLTLFGSPWTPRYGISAFQYSPSDETTGQADSRI